MKRILLALVILSLLFSVAHAVTTNLPNCSQTTVAAAISAATTGDTLACPAGAWSWSSLQITKNITLQGACGNPGVGSTNNCSSGEQTIITLTSANGLQSPSTYGDNETGNFRLTGFTFIANSTFANYTDAMMAIYNGTGWRIDHNTWQSYSTGIGGTGGNVIHVRYKAAGLIDHNRFLAANSSYGGNCSHGIILFSNSGTTSTSTNDQKYSFVNYDPWEALTNPDKAIFVEDNYAYNNQDCDAHNVHFGYGRHGGVAVFRHNEIHFMNIDNHGMRAEHAGYAMQVSNNTWVRDVSGIDLYLMVNIRGGTAVVYNNTVSGTTGSINHGINLWYERATSPGSASNVTISVPTAGTVAANTSCSSNEGYPCAEQPGTGQHTGSAQTDIRDPMYFWSNDNFPTLSNQTGDSWIQLNRDYYNLAKSGWTEYTYPHPLITGEPPPPPDDPNPDSFDFTPVTGAELSTYCASDTVNITGINVTLGSEVSDPRYYGYSVAGSACDNTWKNISNNNAVYLCTTTTAVYDNAVDAGAYLRIYGGADRDTTFANTTPWTCTTKTDPGDSTPPVITDNTADSFPAGTTVIPVMELSNEVSSCRAATDTGVAWDNMVLQLEASGSGLIHTINLGSEAATDNFNRSNANPISGSWTTSGSSTNPLQISSGAVIGVGHLQRNASYYSGTTFPANQCSTLTVTGHGIGPSVRVQAGETYETGYVLRGSTSSSDIKIYRYNLNGTADQIDSTAGTVASGDTLKICVDGTTITAYQNDVAISGLSTSDSTYAGGYPGVEAWSTSVSGDDWVGAGLDTITEGTHHLYVLCRDTSLNEADEVDVEYTIGAESPPASPTGVRVLGPGGSIGSGTTIK